MSEIIDGKKRGKRVSVSVPDYLFNALAAYLSENNSEKSAGERQSKARRWIREKIGLIPVASSYEMQKKIFKEVISKNMLIKLADLENDLEDE